EDPAPQAAPAGTTGVTTGGTTRTPGSLVTGTTLPSVTVSVPPATSNPDAPSASSSSVPGGAPVSTASTPTTNAGAATVSLRAGHDQRERDRHVGDQEPDPGPADRVPQRRRLGDDLHQRDVLTASA